MEYFKMEKLRQMDIRFRVLGGLFLLVTRLETMGNSGRYMGELSTKQWFLLMSLLTIFENPPTVSQVARALGSSHQNIKVVATHLQNKGYVEIRKDTEDARVSRIVPTEKCRPYAKERQNATGSFIGELMSDFTPEEVALLEKMVFRLITRADTMRATTKEAPPSPIIKP